MVRTAIFVADIERSRAFYETVLGMREVYIDVELSTGNTWKLLGQPEGSGCHALILKAEGDPMGMVGLFELKENSPPAVDRPAGARAHIGEGCMVFYCQDLDPVVDALKSGGHEILSPPEPFRVGDEVKQREMIFRDPDGMMINLIEWDLSRAERPELEQGDKG
jgi:catechol 2,3-dioxygenase-like lactoylglutathione lyase family enzyme